MTRYAYLKNQHDSYTTSMGYRVCSFLRTGCMEALDGICYLQRMANKIESALLGMTVEAAEQRSQ